MSVSAVHVLILLCGVLSVLMSVLVADEIIYGYEEGANNLMPNWDFEDDITQYTSSVYCPGSGCQTTTSLDARTGNKSIHVYNRTKSSKGLRHRIRTLEDGKRYYVSMFIKFLNDPILESDKPFSVLLLRKFKYIPSGTSQTSIAILPFNVKTGQWVHIGCDFLMHTDVDYVDFYTKGAPKEVEYLVDSTSLIELPPDPNWRVAANARIQEYRKGPITVTADIDDALTAGDAKIEIFQQFHHFGFGSAVQADVFNAEGDYNDAYRERFCDYFDWGVLENDMKWKPMEPTKGNIKYERIDEALDTLLALGIKVRGHNILWNQQANNPNWVQPLVGQELYDEISRRINYLVPAYSGKVVHWDVINEAMTSNYLETATGVDDLIYDVFENVTLLDPNATLFLNDYAILKEEPKYNAEIGNFARRLLANGANLGGIGIQSHQHDLSITMESLKKRLDIVSAVGLPMWITELSVHATNVTKRAMYLEDFVRMFFSIPLIGGVNLWGFSEWTIFDNNCHLADGEGVVPNEAGDAWYRLVREEWWTEETLVPTSRDFTTNVTVFYGDYTAQLFYDDTLLATESFHLSPGEEVTINANIDDVTTGSIQIN